MQYTREDLRRRLEEEYTNTSAFYRDTTLDKDVLALYKVGVIFQEPTFCDATYKRGGMLAPHRYLITSSNARSLEVFSENPQLGLCVWQPGRFFKVIDIASIDEYTQVTLLEIPEDLLPYFQRDELAFIEQDFASQAVKDFQEAVDLAPLADLNKNEWLDRISSPLGINDDLEYFYKVA